MKSRTKVKCEWLVKHVKEQGYNLQVPIREIRYEISEHLGGDKRTVDKYLHKIVEYGLMKMVNPAVMEFCDAPKSLVNHGNLEKFLVIGEEDDEPP